MPGVSATGVASALMPFLDRKFFSWLLWLRATRVFLIHSIEPGVEMT